MNYFCTCKDCRTRPLADRWHDYSQLSFNDEEKQFPDFNALLQEDARIITRMRLIERFGENANKHSDANRRRSNRRSRSAKKILSRTNAVRSHRVQKSRTP